MIIDLNKIEHDPFNNKIFDFCICGAGVAGITLALKLSLKFNVLLIEGGDLDYSEESQQLYKGNITGQRYFTPDITRLRYFGGTSNHWSGWCTPMQEHDFKSKPYVEYSGWPIQRADLEPYLREAEEILDLPVSYDYSEYSSGWNADKFITASGDLKTLRYKWSAPTRFGKKFKTEIENSKNISCFLNANIIDLELNQNLSHLDTLEIKNFSGKSFKIAAKTYVLATGGIENPRILLNANKQLKNGLGNKNDLVGRFFTDHNNKDVGEFILEDTARNGLIKKWSDDWKKNNSYFSPSKEFIHRKQILNFGIFIEPNDSITLKRSFKDKLQHLLCDIDFTQGSIEKIYDKPCPVDGTIRVVSEQALNPASRIILSQESDRFGLKRINIDWKQSEIDKTTIQEATICLAEIFAKNSIGRIRIEDWVLTNDLVYPINDEVAGHHHMCTTRMSDSPEKGVVDRNQRVFDINNLYIAGSSVFSNPGHDSPTITIVQMTLRLAKHLEDSQMNTQA